METFEKSYKEMCSIIQKIAQRVGDGTNIVRFATCAANMLVIYNKSQKPEYFMRLFRDFYREYQFNLLSPLYEGENANPNVKWLKEIRKITAARRKEPVVVSSFSTM